MKIARNTILVKLRFLDIAIAELDVDSFEIKTVGTDGREIYYNPFYILSRYSEEKYVVMRDYLHMLFHCVFRHNLIGSIVDTELWDLSCDIAVENVINELQEQSIYAKRQGKQSSEIIRLKSKIKHLTAEKIYNFYLSQGLDDEEIRRLRVSFIADDHTIWYSSGDGSSEGQGQGKQGQSGGKMSRQELEQRWKQISEYVGADLESFSKQRGNTAGSLIQNIREVNRERYDYTSFLKKFATMHEAMKINDDEFDYIFYTYGLKLYEKMPLIEPLEYKEIKQVKDFAIIIDTSGSVQGAQVQAFVQKTYNILKNEESFAKKFNLHIIQCDAEVQSDVKITTQAELDEYIKKMTLHGFGGTDFRPAFAYVNKLVKDKEFTKLKGVIYFTDGYGVFPERKPDYETAFVFVREDYEIPQVPTWAIKLILEKEDLDNL
ncbi:MAG: metallopeptidase [Clostridia bacterium]|nr:metallopeptidase [Clostridia bacterium]